MVPKLYINIYTGKEHFNIKQKEKRKKDIYILCINFINNCTFR
jgi:hypothetical protein